MEKICKNCKWWNGMDWCDAGECQNHNIREALCITTHKGVVFESDVKSIITNQDFGCAHFEGKSTSSDVATRIRQENEKKIS